MNNDPTISSIMNLAKLFTPGPGPHSKSSTQDKSWPMFPLDAQIHTEPLRVCKSLIPYLPYEKQKNLSIFIKIYELISVVEHFSTASDYPDQKPDFRESESWQTDLLYSVKDNLDPKNAYWVDIFFKIKEVSKLLEAAKSGEVPEPDLAPATNKPAPSKEFTQNISPMLDDHQKKMLDVLSTIMK